MNKLTREEILRMPVSGKGGLRQACIELGIKSVEQGGEIINTYSAKKPVLQEALLALIEDKTAPTVEDLDNLAQRYWGQIKEYALTLYRADKLGDNPYYHAEDGGLASIALNFVMGLSTRPSDHSDNGLIEPATVKNLKSLLKADIYSLMNNDVDIRLQAHLPHVRYIFNKLFGYLDEQEGGRKYRPGLIDQALAQITVQKKVKEQKAVLQRKMEPSHVRITRLYNWAFDTLASYQTKNFKDVSLALQLTTGRRPSEIHSTAKFEFTDRPNWVIFWGQRKTKGRTDAEPSYEIPVLASPQLVVAALDWLGANGKRVPEGIGSDEARAKKANDTWSSDLNKQAKNIDNYIDYEVRGKREHPKTGTLEDVKLTCNGCRDIYAQVVTKLYLKPQDRLMQMGQFLGHRLADSLTTERYDIDYKVLETEEELRDLFNLAQP